MNVGAWEGRLVIGFDLDMTLIDSRPPIGAAIAALATETGAPIDVDHITATLGPPIEVALAPWFSGAALAAAADRFRELVGPLLHLTLPMTGAVAAVGAVRDRGGRVLVVTAKNEPHAWISLETVGITVDAVAGGRLGATKADPLREFRAQAYVGDHLADVAAAKAAGVLSVSVATGSTPSAALRRSGTDVVLPDLVQFPQWFSEWPWLDEALPCDERTSIG